MMLMMMISEWNPYPHISLFSGEFFLLSQKEFLSLSLSLLHIDGGTDIESMCD